MGSEVKVELLANSSSISSNSENSDIISCFYCDISIQDTYFKCSTCFSSNIAEHFCKNCILSHLRKGHEIIDNHGTQVPICEQHKNIAFKFCNDCNVQFCMDCIETHIGHQFVSLQTRNAEIRRKLQSNLAELEKYASHIRKRKLIMEQISSKISRTESECDIAAKVEQILCGLTEKATSSVGREVTNIEWIVSLSTKRDKTLQEMRKLVGGSNYSSEDVQSSVRRCRESIAEKENELMKSHVFLQPLQFTQAVQSIQETLFEKLMELIKGPKLEVMAVQQLPKGRKLFAGYAKNESKYGLFVHNRSVSGKLLNITKSGENKISVGSVQFDGTPKIKGGRKSGTLNNVKLADIKDVYAWGGLLALILEENTEIFDLETLDNLACLQTVSTSRESGQKYVIYVYGSDASDYELVLWDTGLKALTFSSKDLKSLQLPCSKLPVCADLYFEGSIFAYANVDQQVIVSYLESKNQVKIERDEHGLFAVDEMHFLGDRLLILYEKESRVIVVLSEKVSQNNWNVSSVHQLNEDRNYANEFGIGANLSVERPVLTDAHYCEKEKCCRKGQFVYGSGRQIERKNCCNFEPIDCDEIVFENRFYANFTGCRHTMNSDASSNAVSSTSR